MSPANPTPATPASPTRAFREALGAFATGVTIVTTRSPAGEDIGITANSFNSVSLDPPMVLWSLSKKAKSLDAFLESGYFAVHVLASSQEHLSTVFATQGAAKFTGLAVERATSGVPLLPDCAARFQCRTAFTYDGGDHVILVGEVEAFDHFAHPPLVFQRGRYAIAVEKGPAPPPAHSADSELPGTFSQDSLIYLLGRAHHQLFMELRRDLESHGLTEDGFFVLSMLGVAPERTVAELDKLLWYTGNRVTYELVASLSAGGFLRLDGGYDPHARVALTPKGKRLVIELAAVAKAAESRAERTLGFGETQLMKQALRSVIGDTAAGTPPLQPASHPE